MAELSLAEELVLLALNEDGSIPPLRVGEVLDIALAGAQLLDLTLQEQVRLKNSRIKTSHLAPPSGVALRRSLSRIAEQPKPRKHDFPVVQGFAQGSARADGRTRVDRAAAGPDAESHPVHSLTKERDPLVEDEIRERLRVVLLEGVDPDSRDAGLIAVIRASHLERLFLDRTERKAARARLNQLALPRGALGEAAVAAAEVVKGLRDTIASTSAG